MAAPSTAEILCRVADAVDRGVPIANALRNVARGLEPELETSPLARREAEIAEARKGAEAARKRKRD